ncbi:unnamed protein product [Euphydryas editha]|uniref:Uncharacterized protein n=1 Tax=Euphydryas editha TaxID=104508 RepID=A0AAU9TTC6_EUPED|nr:unnamed protein product [Euphydryas editha]
MRGVMVDALDVNECPPLVYIHYCMHSACFSDVFQILRKHGCNVDYSSYIRIFKGERFIPDAFIASLTSNSSTSHVMLPHSLYCDPEYLLAHVCKYELLGSIPQMKDRLLVCIIHAFRLYTEIVSY